MILHVDEQRGFRNLSKSSFYRRAPGSRVVAHTYMRSCIAPQKNNKMCYTPIEHSLTTSSYTAEKRAAIGVSRTLTTITTFILMQSELAKACEIHPRVQFNNENYTIQMNQSILQRVQSGNFTCMHMQAISFNPLDLE